MKSLAGEGYDFEVKWRPYQLAPDISREGRNKREYYDVSAASKPIAICNMLCPTRTVRASILHCSKKRVHLLASPDSPPSSRPNPRLARSLASPVPPPLPHSRFALVSLSCPTRGIKTNTPPIP